MYKERNKLLKQILNEFEQDVCKTAREIVSFLKKKGTIHTEYDWNDYLQIDVDDFYKLARELGVEVKDIKYGK